MSSHRARNPMTLHSDFGVGIIFAAGYHARTVGDARAAFPGNKGGPDMSAWLAGWDEAQSELTKIDHSEANPSPVS
jgi:hypothetical protein